MPKVSIGLRGWRFEESDVFDEDGQLRPLGEIPEDARHRLVRLSALVGEPCSACWLIHGEADIDECNAGTIVYGEPLAEVLLCDDHEPDFLYWFREADGREFAGTAAVRERFHEWFDAGNRAPEGYGGLDHVDESPGDLPDVDGTASPDGPDGEETLSEIERAVGEMTEAEREAAGVELDDLDIDLDPDP